MNDDLVQDDLGPSADEREAARERARQFILRGQKNPPLPRPPRAPHRDQIASAEPISHSDHSVINPEYDAVEAGEFDEHLSRTLPPPPENKRQKHLDAVRLNIDEVARAIEKLRNLDDSKELLKAARDLRPLVTAIVAEAIEYEKEHNKLRHAKRRNEARAHQHQFIKDVIDDMCNEAVFPSRPEVAHRIGRRSLSPHEERVRQLWVRKRIEDGWIRDPDLSSAEAEEIMFQYRLAVLNSRREYEQGCIDQASNPPSTT